MEKNAENTEYTEKRRGTEPGDQRNCKVIFLNSSQKQEKD